MEIPSSLACLLNFPRLYVQPVVFDPQSRPMATLDESVKGALLRGERVGKARLPCIYPSEKVTYALKKILNKRKSSWRSYSIHCTSS